MTLLILIVGVVLLFMMFGLRSRVERIEKIIQATTLVPGSVQQPTPPPLGQPEQLSQSIPAPTPAKHIPTPAEPDAVDRFVEWLKDDWLLKLGALLLLIGFGWLATYAFLNNWIGPMGRIVLGISAGALFLLLGQWRIKTYLHQGGTFLVLGSTTILLTIFAAREIYGFFTPLTALSVMFLSTVFVAYVSVVYKNRALALASLILAGIAPLLTASPAPDYVGLFWYLLVVMLGAIWVVILTGQRILTMAALMLVFFYSIPHLNSFVSTDSGILLIFAYAFAAIFFLTNTAGILKLKGKDLIPDLITAGGNGIFLLAWIIMAAPEQWQSLIIAAWLIVFIAGAFLVFKTTQKRGPFYVYTGVSIMMLAAATAVELSGASLVIAYTIESALIALISYEILHDARIAGRLSLLLIGPTILSINSILSSAWYKYASVFHKDFFVLLILSLSLFLLGLFFKRRQEESSDPELKNYSAVLLVAGSVYAYILVWLSLHAVLKNDDTAVMISLVLYTLVGLATYFYGITTGTKGLKIYGGTLLGFVVGRLILVDVWHMAISGRIITFFMIGALLITTAFFSKKQKNITQPPIQ